MAPFAGPNNGPREPCGFFFYEQPPIIHHLGYTPHSPPMLFNQKCLMHLRAWFHLYHLKSPGYGTGNPRQISSVSMLAYMQARMRHSSPQEIPILPNSSLGHFPFYCARLMRWLLPYFECSLVFTQPQSRTILFIVLKQKKCTNNNIST